MRISFEAECFPLFVTGVLVLLAGEVLFALLALRRRPEARGPLLAHVLCVAVAFFAWDGCCLFRSPRRTAMSIIAPYCWLPSAFSGSWESAAVCGH